jgi:hypothetical protein
MCRVIVFSPCLQLFFKINLSIFSKVTVEVEAQAPAGQILTIEQAVGHCDGSSVKTEMYKISHFTPKGQLISSKLVHAKDL